MKSCYLTICLEHGQVQRYVRIQAIKLGFVSVYTTYIADTERCPHTESYPRHCHSCVSLSGILPYIPLLSSHSVHTYLLNPWCRVLLEKLTGLQLVNPHFTEPEGSLPHSQASATCLYPVPAQDSPHTHIPPPYGSQLHVSRNSRSFFKFATTNVCDVNPLCHSISVDLIHRDTTLELRTSFSRT